MIPVPITFPIVCSKTLVSFLLHLKSIVPFCCSCLRGIAGYGRPPISALDEKLDVVVQ